MNSQLQFHNWQILFTFALCAVAALANAADPDDQIYDESPDGRFGFRDSFAGAAKTEQSEIPDDLSQRCTSQECCEKEIITCLSDREARHGIRCVRHLREKTK